MQDSFNTQENTQNQAQRPLTPRPQLTFKEAVTICIKDKYCNFKGRARRSEYWWFQLATAILGWVLGMIASSIYFSSHSVNEYLNNPYSFILSPEYIITLIISLALFLPQLGVAVRRLHDTGKSGKWLFMFFLAIIPIVGIFIAIAMAIILLVWYCKDSDPGENKYGPSPKYQ